MINYYGFRLSSNIIRTGVILMKSRACRPVGLSQIATFTARQSPENQQQPIPESRVHVAVNNRVVAGMGHCQSVKRDVNVRFPVILYIRVEYLEKN